ncbi:UPF0149 family protein [Endozoicomonas arenosclerae]|uniref:UPF0149 family protein n=1 Tax=Endozoicomonas arenosclerae TaxID=1633495 RepID=UPI000A4C64B5|nr:UPF0149 family protein [Endozoicomonas arenosclerae]
MTNNDAAIEAVAFDELADRLVEMGGGSHPSELHGILCGTFAAGSQPGVETWFRQVAGLLDDQELDSRFQDVLSNMYQGTLQQLDQSDFSIALLLPDDEEALEQRTEALGYWCQGFLSGFGEVIGNKSLSEAVEGVLSDFSEIAQIQPEPDDSDESERFFMEVSEFVRMALITVFSEVTSQEKKKGSEKKTIH